MCGRFSQIFSWGDLQQLIDPKIAETIFTKSYNIAPTQHAVVVHLNASLNLQVEVFNWGLIPSWSKDKKYAGSMINARAETIQIKPAFRAAFKKRRCIVPVSGFYEWNTIRKKEGKKEKEPYYITSTNSKILFFAGIWEQWQNEEQQKINSFSIITTSANEKISLFHDRMPVILSLDNCKNWLSLDTNLDTINSYLIANTTEPINIKRVSSFVNSPKNNTEECIK